MVQRALSKGVDVNNIKLRGDEARTMLQEFGYWYVNTYPEEGVTKEMIDQMLENPSTYYVDFNNYEFSDIHSILLMSIVNGNVDMVRFLTNAGYNIRRMDIVYLDYDTPLSEPMTALLRQLVSGHP
jgi:hypothetical protein